MTPSTRRARLLACAALAAPALLFCSPFLFSSRCLDAGDFRDYFGPHAAFAASQFRETGSLPNWNPMQYAGVPFLSTGQNNFYYPPLSLFLVLPLHAAFELLLLLHLWLAAAGMYRLARSLGLRRSPSVVAGLAYSLSFVLTARAMAGHLPNFITLCQAPALLLLVRRVVLLPTPGRIAALAAWTAAVLVAGSPQFVYQLALVALAWSAFELTARARRGAAWAPALGALAAAGVAGTALAAVHLVPLLETAFQSTRQSAEVAALAAPYHDFSLYHLSLLTVPRYFWHDVSDPWLWHEKALYAGVLPLFLSASALHRRKTPAVLFFLGVALVALIEASTGALFSALPGYGGFRIPERSVWLVCLSMSVLAGFGADAACDRPPGRTALGVALAAAAAWTVALAAGFRAGAGAAIFASLAVLSILGWFLYARNPGIAIAVLAADLIGAGVLQMRTGVSGQVEPAPWYAAHIGPERSAYRILDLVTVYRASPVLHGFRLLRGYGHPVLPGVARLYESAWSSSIPAIDTLPTIGGLRDVSALRDLNVRWIVGGPPHPDWKRVAEFQGSVLYEDPGARPLAFVPGRGSVSEGRRVGADRVDALAHLDAPGVLALSEAWAPGWTAERNGEPIPVGKYREALVQVELPAGESTVVFRYAPRSRKVGAALSGAGALAVLLATALGMRWARRRESSS